MKGHDIVQNSNRVPIFDVLKGTAIVLMIVNHVSLDRAWLSNLIGVFHMPLFFLISGYLYKPRALKEAIERNLFKILLPYLITCIIIWTIMCLFYGQYQWGMSILWGNSKPAHGCSGVGPLWFLTAFFWTMIYANLLLKITSKQVRWIVMIIIFVISVVFVHIFGLLLPFGLTTAIGGVVFLFAGMEIKENPQYVLDKKYVYGGLAIWAICVVFGGCAMAWHVYKLNLLQVVGGIYGTYLCYRIVEQFRTSSIFWRGLCFVGVNSLPIFCIHSIDRVANLTYQLTNFFLGYSNNDIAHWQLEVLLKFIFVIIIFLLFMQIPVIRRLFMIKSWNASIVKS